MEEPKHVVIVIQDTIVLEAQIDRNVEKGTIVQVKAEERANQGTLVQEALDQIVVRLSTYILLLISWYNCNTILLN